MFANWKRSILFIALAAFVAGIMLPERRQFLGFFP